MENWLAFKQFNLGDHCVHWKCFTTENYTHKLAIDIVSEYIILQHTGGMKYPNGSNFHSVIIIVSGSNST